MDGDNHLCTKNPPIVGRSLSKFVRKFELSGLYVKYSANQICAPRSIKQWFGVLGDT